LLLTVTTASASYAFQCPPEAGHIEDRNPLDGTQRKEIGVGTHDIVRPPGDRTFEKLIVARVPAEAEGDGGLNELGPPAKEPQERASSDWTGTELFKYRGSTQDALDLGSDGVGLQENETVGTPGPVNLGGQALGAGKGAAQENLRVKNDSGPGQRGRPRL